MRLPMLPLPIVERLEVMQVKKKRKEKEDCGRGYGLSIDRADSKHSHGYKSLWCFVYPTRVFSHVILSHLNLSRTRPWKEVESSNLLNVS